MRDDDMPITGEELKDLDDLAQLTKFPGWKYFTRLLNKHRIYCIETSNKHLENHADRKAGEWLARSKEPGKLLNLIEKRKKEISDKRERQDQ